MPTILRNLVSLTFTVAAAISLYPHPAFGFIEGENWLPIGPAPIMGFFEGGATGRASAVTANPGNPQEVWVGGATGGLWHTLDGGKTWRSLSDKVPALAVGAIAVADCSESGCGTIYMGTGENAIRRDTYYGQGVLISERDEFGGIGWRRVTGATEYDFRLGSVNDLLLDPRTSGAGQHIYLTLSSGLTVSASEASLTAPEPDPGGYGIYKSEDNGAGWRKLSVPGSAGARPTDLKIVVPDEGDAPPTLYAGFLGRGVFRSTDGGASWCALSAGTGAPTDGCPTATGLREVSDTFDWVEVAVAPQTASTLYATFGQCPDPLGRCPNGVATYKSTTGGDSWTLQSDRLRVGGSTENSYSRYTHGLAVDPTDAETILVGAVDLLRSEDSGQTFANSDDVLACPAMSPGGDDCVTIMGARDDVVHLDHREIRFHPSDTNIAYDVSDGGFAISFDGGCNWLPRNNGLPLVGFHSVATSPDIGGIVGGSQDNGVQIWNGQASWQHGGTWGSDAGFTIIDRLDPAIVYAASNNGNPRVSTVGGLDWSDIVAGLGAGAGEDIEHARIFYAPLHQDVDAPHDLYLGAERLYRRPRGDVSAGSWEPVSPVLATGTSTEIWTAPTVHRNTMTAVGLASGSARAYVGYYLGEVFTSDNPCPNPDCWTQVGGARFPDAPVTWIAVRPGDADTAYVTFSGFGPEAKVWKITGGGTDVEPVSEGLPARVPANTISIEPSSANRLWLGLDSHPDPLPPEGGSVFRSTDGGASWEPVNRGLPNVPVYELEVDEAHGRIVAATHGRGAYVLGEPFLSNLEGWVDGSIWDIPIYGRNFLPNQSCSVDLLRTDASVCATGATDATGAAIGTDDRGVLTRTDTTASFYEEQEVVWGCLNRRCIGGVDIGQCVDVDSNGDGVVDPISTIVVRCGAQVATQTIFGCPPLSNPPSSVFDIDLAEAPPTGGGGDGGGDGPNGGGEASQSFQLSATVQSLNDTRSLCTVTVPFVPSDDRAAVLARAHRLVAASASCRAAGVEPLLVGGDPGPGEDEFGSIPHLYLRAPGITGAQLITALHSAPGAMIGSCLMVGELGNPLLGQIQILKLDLKTLPSGAEGGRITFVEQSSLGNCGISVETRSGQSAGEVARAVYEAFQAPGIPGPNPGCPSDRNLRDVSLHGDSTLIFVAATTVKMCSADPGIALTLRSEELANVHPAADAGGDRTLPWQPGGVDLTLEGSGSRDPDSTPGTNDDIVTFHWYEVGDDVNSLGTGQSLPVHLDEGLHRIRLVVTDEAGLSDIDESLIDIEKTDRNLIWIMLLIGLLIGLLLCLLFGLLFRRRRLHRGPPDRL